MLHVEIKWSYSTSMLNTCTVIIFRATFKGLVKRIYSIMTVSLYIAKQSQTGHAQSKPTAGRSPIYNALWRILWYTQVTMWSHDGHMTQGYICGHMTVTWHGWYISHLQSWKLAIDMRVRDNLKSFVKRSFHVKLYTFSNFFIQFS